jgi:hypothetical protein
MDAFIGFGTAGVLGLIAACVMIFVNAYKQREVLDPSAALFMTALICIIGAAVCSFQFEITGWMLIPATMVAGVATAGAGALLIGVIAGGVFLFIRLMGASLRFGSKTRDFVDRLRDRGGIENTEA